MRVGRAQRAVWLVQATGRNSSSPQIRHRTSTELAEQAEKRSRNPCVTTEQAAMSNEAALLFARMLTLIFEAASDAYVTTVQDATTQEEE